MTLQPATVEALQAEVLAHETIRVRAGGTKSAPDEGATLCLRALTGIIDYSPDECVLTARAGTPLAEIEHALTAKGQYLPFDPPLASRGATIGGTVAAGISGPLRYRYIGLYRTSFLAFERFGVGRQPAEGLRQAQGIEFAYEIIDISGDRGASTQ